MGREGGKEKEREGEKEEGERGRVARLKGERDDEGGRKEGWEGDRLASPQAMNIQVDIFPHEHDIVSKRSKRKGNVLLLFSQLHVIHCVCDIHPLIARYGCLVPY